MTGLGNSIIASAFGYLSICHRSLFVFEQLYYDFFITLVKLHIWISRNHGVTPNLSAFKNLVKARFRTEKYQETMIYSYEK